MQQKLLSVTNESKVNGVRKSTKNASGKYGLHTSLTFHCCLFWARLNEGAGLTINYPAPNPEHATLQTSTSEHDWNLTKTEIEPGIRGDPGALETKPNLGGIEEEENIPNNNTIKYVTWHVSKTQLQGGPKQLSAETWSLYPLDA